MTKLYILGAIASVIGLLIIVLKIKSVKKRLKWFATLLISFFTNALVVSIIILLLLSLSVYLAIEIFNIKQLVDAKRSIPINIKTSGIYNAADDRKEFYPNGGRIRAIGQVVQSQESKNHIYFRYLVIERKEKILQESSGAYITFYESPVDFLAYSLLTFYTKGEGNNGNPDNDLGIRLIVDDSKALLGEREKVIRVLPSLQDIGIGISKHWKKISIDLSEFAMLPYMKPLPNNLSPNVITKIVFFVGNEIVNRYPQGTIYIKDLAFEK